MQKGYDELIEGMSQMVAKAMLQNAEHKSLLLQGDRILSQLFRQIGLASLLIIAENLIEEEVASIKKEGFRVHRRPVVPVHTTFGTLELQAPYMWKRNTGESIKPLDKRLQVSAHMYTPALKKAFVDFGIEESFALAAQRFEEHYGWEPSESAIRRWTLEFGQEAEEYIDTRLVQNQPDYEKPPIERPGVDELMVQLDGSNVRTGELVVEKGRKRTKVRKLRKKKRIEEWKEVRVGLVRRLDQAQKKFVAQMNGYPEVCQQLFEVTIEKGLTCESQVIAVADGGNGLYEELQNHFPNMVFILDVYHVKENLYETASALGLEGELREDWVQEKFGLLWRGKLKKAFKTLEEELSRSGDNERLNKLIKYLIRFKKCLNYREFKEKGWPIGSGEVESAHRYIPQKRLKGPGTWWKKEHVNPMLALRVLRANDWWKVFWLQRSQHLEKAV